MRQRNSKPVSHVFEAVELDTPAQLVDQDLCYLEVCVNIIDAQNLLEVLFSFQILDCCDELLVIEKSVHVEVDDQDRYIVLLDHVCVQGQMTPCSNCH